MASIDEIKNCINIFLKNKVDLKNITVLHCNTDYPTLMKDVNLKAMLDIKSKLKVDIGLSDHSLGIEVPVAAVALGARVIEKHFTISKEMAGPDHSASLDEIELTNMISSIRNVNIALSGTGLKNPTKSELKNKIYVRKSIHIKNNLKAGKKIVNDDLIMLRPGDGISPMKVNNFIGKVTSKNLKSGSKLKLTDLK
jgi:sialic acid synthase SpsE